MKISVITFLIGVVVGAALIYFLFWPKVEEVVKYTIETKWVEKDTTIYNYRDTLITKIVSVEASPEPSKYDSIRTYEDKIDFDFGSIYWSARVLGQLDKIEFTPKIKYPIVTNTKTTVKFIKPKRLYGVASYRFDGEISIGLTYTNDRLLIGYDYTPELKLHEGKIGIKIFGK